MLHDFIIINRDEIVRRCRAKVATRSIPPPTDVEIDHGVPLFLNQLAEALRSLVSPSAGGALKRTMAGSLRAASLMWDASLPSTSPAIPSPRCDQLLTHRRPDMR
jgi:hypothetical protein